ncbi:MAG: hypothetical protein ACRC1T_09450 [Clostridium chrysemydis]|uniref:hypothetical protein n=1 Tax=Clostridium chrysemydis TaxID=2665504 RepID=UPI003F2E4C06
MYSYKNENKYHTCIGFGEVDGIIKPIYFDKKEKKYKILETSVRKIKNKATKEEVEVFNGMNWRFLDESEIKIVGGDK